MNRKDQRVKEYHDWCYCPNNPGVLRRIVGFDNEEMPIIEEKNINDVRKLYKYIKIKEARE